MHMIVKTITRSLLKRFGHCRKKKKKDAEIDEKDKKGKSKKISP